jgi:predicted alpha-1,6-mannanase (GH76 family)
MSNFLSFYLQNCPIVYWPAAGKDAGTRPQFASTLQHIYHATMSLSHTSRYLYRWPVVAAVICCLLLSDFGAAQQARPSTTVPHAEQVRRSRAAAAALLRLYDKENGLFTTTGWWNAANAVTALADESRVADDPNVRSIFPETLALAQHRFPAFLNEFYDDEGWWALAWIDVSDLDRHAKLSRQYLQTAEAIFDDTAKGWDDTCGGGIWWKKDRHYKNAIANELFFSVAGSLALHTHGKQRALYQDWADREWRWFSQSGMINGDNLINDGLDASCKNNGKTQWSYNQGVVLGGLVSLSRVEPQADLLSTADRIAHATITHLTDAQGILHDPCEPKCGEDGVQFKGIFTRNLRQLQAVSKDPAFVDFLQRNAESLWSNARTTDDRFSTVWSGPAEEGNAGAQTSALDALVAATATSRAKHR